MDKQEFIIRFEGLSSAEANVEAQRLQEMLADASPDIDVKLRRERAESMDMGTTLELLLGTPAIIVATKGFASWLGQRGKRQTQRQVKLVDADHQNGDAKRLDVTLGRESVREQAFVPCPRQPPRVSGDAVDLVDHRG